MNFSSTIKSGGGDGFEAKVNELGQLLVLDGLSYSEAYPVQVSAINTAFNLVKPRPDRRFVITAIILDADKSVSGTTAATVEIYEASSITDLAGSKSILSLEMLKNTNRIVTGISLIITQGEWLNIKTTDDNIAATVLGYYVDA